MNDPKGQTWLELTFDDEDGEGRKEQVTEQVWGGDSLTIAYNLEGGSTTLTDRIGETHSYLHNASGQAAKPYHTPQYYAKRSAYKKYVSRQKAKEYNPEGINTWAKTSGYDVGIRQHRLNISVHGNIAGSQTATLYAKFRNGIFQKWGVTKHTDPTKRYSNLGIGDEVRRMRTGPRFQELARERRLVERFPGPENFERWAGWKNPNHPNYRGGPR